LMITICCCSTAATALVQPNAVQVCQMLSADVLLTCYPALARTITASHSFLRAGQWGHSRSSAANAVQVLLVSQIMFACFTALASCYMHSHSTTGTITASHPFLRAGQWGRSRSSAANAVQLLPVSQIMFACFTALASCYIYSHSSTSTITASHALRAGQWGRSGGCSWYWT
jgi:uncharacterized membrane protein